MSMPPYITREDRVKEFLAASREPSCEVVWNCYTEENIEMKEAAEEFHMTLVDPDATIEDKAAARAAFVKEVADVQYVLSQLAIFYDIDLQTAFNRVATNNMTKVQDGKIVYRETDGKILKPEGYEKPDMRGL